MTFFERETLSDGPMFNRDDVEAWGDRMDLTEVPRQTMSEVVAPDVSGLKGAFMALGEAEGDRIRGRLEQQIDQEVTGILGRVLDRLVEDDKTGVFAEALANATEATGQSPDEFGFMRELAQTMRLRLEQMYAEGKLEDAAGLAEVTGAVEIALVGHLRRLAAVDAEKKKTPPADEASGDEAQPLAA